jgi:hypothetical protein
MTFDPLSLIGFWSFLVLIFAVQAAGNRLNGLPFAFSHGTRSSTAKNPNICADA